MENESNDSTGQNYDNGSLEDMFKKVKKQIKTKTDKLKQDIDNKTGVAGGLAQVVESTIEAGKRAVDKIDKKAEEAGGYDKLAQNTWDKITGKADEAYKSIEDKFFKEGKYDPIKAKQSFKDEATIIAQYGVKAGKVLIDLGKDARDIIFPSWSNMRPSKEDLEGKYAGIGTKYKGPLFKQNYDKCLEYHAKVDDRFKDKNMLIDKKDNILEDIKASASSDTASLLKFYRDSRDLDIAKQMMVRKYLTDL